MADFLNNDDEFNRALNVADAALGPNPSMGTPQAMRVGAPAPMPVSQMVENIQQTNQMQPMQVNEPAMPASTTEPMEQSGTGDLAPTLPPQLPPKQQAPGFVPVFAPNLGNINAALARSRGASQESARLIGEANQATQSQIQAEGRALDAAAEAGRLKALAEQRENEAKLQADQDYLKEQQKIRDMANQKKADIQNKIQEQDQAYRERKIDPRRMWANTSTPNKILAGISMALGAIGAGLTGRGNNPAVDVIQKAIDDDVNLQKEQIERARQAGVDLRTQLGDIENITGNSIAALELTKAQRYNQAAMDLSKEMAKIRTPEALAVAEKAKAELLARSAESNAKAAAAISESVDKDVGRQLQGESLRQDAISRANAANVEAAKAMGKEQGASSAFRPIEGSAPSEDDIKEAKKIYSKAGGALSSARKLEELSNKLSTGEKVTMTGEDANLARTIAQSMPFQIGQAFGQGAITKEQQEAFADMVRDPSKFDWVGRGPSLNAAMRTMIETNLNESLRPYNVEINTGRKKKLGIGL